MKICGPKLSICCTILSAWAIIQLGLMGIFFFIESPAFIEDLYIPETVPEGNSTAFIYAMKASYSQISTNCWIATALYCGTFLFSGWQMWTNLKA